MLHPTLQSAKVGDGDGGGLGGGHTDGEVTQASGCRGVTLPLPMPQEFPEVESGVLGKAAQAKAAQAKATQAKASPIVLTDKRSCAALKEAVSGQL